MVVAQATTPAAAPEVRKLAVLLKLGGGAFPNTAEELVQTLSETPQSTLTQRLQNPSKTSLLISNRLPVGYRVNLPVGDPDEILHRYIVLEFPNSATALAAKAALLKYPLVEYVVLEHWRAAHLLIEIHDDA